MPKLAYSNVGGKALSYSRRQTLKTCERKFELENVIGYRPSEDNMTFAYGHFVGEAIQQYLLTHDLQWSLFQGMLAFDIADPWIEPTAKNIKNKKSFWYAIEIVEAFHREMERRDTLLWQEFRDLEVAYFTYNGERIPAAELTFEIDCGDGWTYEGHIDLVMYDKRTNTYVIVELKTTSLVNLHPAMFQNSDQALSYSVVLDKIAGNLNANSSYKVLYLCAKSTRHEFQTFRFPKSVLDRSHWIAHLQQDMAYLEMLLDDADEAGIHFPTRGDACYSFFQPCQYFGNCHQDNSHFQNLKVQWDSMETSDGDNAAFAEQGPAMFQFTLQEIIERQQEILAQKIPVTEPATSSEGEIEIL